MFGVKNIMLQLSNYGIIDSLTHTRAHDLCPYFVGTVKQRSAGSVPRGVSSAEYQVP